MNFGIQGAKVRLVPLDIDKHLENYYRWLNDPEVTKWLLTGRFPLTRLAERAFLEEASAQNEKRIIFAIETLEGVHIGGSGVTDIDWINRTALTGTFIGAKDLWGQGFGTDAAIARTRYCFDTLNLHTLTSATFDGNERSLKMQQAAGYQVAGRFPERLWIEGKWVDEILTCCTRESWQASLKAAQT